jgi:hypothetical protein
MRIIKSEDGRMTEAEAKTKWCPFYQVALAMTSDSVGELSNRLSGGLNHNNCIGSACMAWRTYDDGRQGCCGLAQ